MNEIYASSAPGLGSDVGAGGGMSFDFTWLSAVQRLRRGFAISDSQWDRCYPRHHAQRSSTYWTPVSIARRAACLLSRGPATRILDVGAGVGKFCVIGALTTPAAFAGVERCGERVDVARRTAERARAPRVRFVHGRAEDLDWGGFDGFYFYNPFEELAWPDLANPSEIEGVVECERLITLAQGALAGAKPGTRVVTYHGFGGNVPPCFQLLLREPHGTDFLECWQKR